jgi:hypothetical protein
MLNDISNGNREDVLERLEIALDGRRRWLGERLQGSWLNEGDQKEPTQIQSFWERFMGSRTRTRTNTEE